MIPIAKPTIGEEEKSAVIRVLESGMLAQGKITAEFEKRFAEFCKVKHAILTSSGTTALHTCLHSIGVKQSDEVITSPFTFVASANCILMQQAKPVFVDIGPETFNIDPKLVQEKLTESTRAIIPIDLYGQVFDYEPIKRICQSNNLLIVEDACQAVGAELEGIKAGNFGDMAAFSLYATKNIVSGEGGIITTNNDEMAQKARRFINHGQEQRYEYLELGYNYRITDIQAAIALEQLKKVEAITRKRIENARLLTDGLSKTKGIRVPKVKTGCRHVFHQYTIVIDGYRLSRDELLDKLRKEGIGANIYYPKPLHLTKCYEKFGYKKGDFPIAEEMAEKVLSLPVHPNVSQQDIEKIIEVIR